MIQQYIKCITWPKMDELNEFPPCQKSPLVPESLIFGATSEVRQTGKSSQVEIRLTAVKPNPSLLRAFGRGRAAKKPGGNYLNICTRRRNTGV